MQNTMTGNYLLDWALLAISLNNVILLLWLGLTVLLNAERRTGGVWLVGGALLLGGAFFLAHTAILGLGTEITSAPLDFWWRLGWTPLLLVPYAWYAITLWYGGFWEKPSSHRYAIFFITLLVVALAGMFLFTTVLPSFTQLVTLDFSQALTLRGVPVLLIVYPLYIILCLLLALDALRHPTPTENELNNEARRRARPWLVATTISLLAVSLLVALIIAWVFSVARQIDLFPGLHFDEVSLLRFLPDGRYGTINTVVAWFDLAIALLLALTSAFVGQAIVSYEIFSGRALPRGDLRRHWRNALILAAGYGVIVGGSLTLRVPPIYVLLLTVLLVTVFYALLGWRTFARHDLIMRRLRPFASSQHLYEQMLSAPADATFREGTAPSRKEVASTPSGKVQFLPGRLSTPPRPYPAVDEAEPPYDLHTPFSALCRDVLNTDLAVLAALGSLAPLVDPPLSYPATVAPTAYQPQIAQIAQMSFDPRSSAFIRVPKQEEGDKVRYAVPLWSERGLIGVLLLGAKRDGALYTQEEIEIARATGERLIDTLASIEIGRRLLILQRQRLAESQVIDRQTRRLLHDEVLPELHTALLVLNAGGDTAVEQANQVLTSVHRRIAALLREAPVQAVASLEQGLLAGLRILVDVEMGKLFDSVRWQVDEDAPLLAEKLSPLAQEVVFYAVREAVRNAARHGRGGDAARALNLTIAMRSDNGITICVGDDGVGVQANQHGAASTGQGLALHSTLLAILGGSLRVEQGKGGTVVWVQVGV